jgi:hypothetical protein
MQGQRTLSRLSDRRVHSSSYTCHTPFSAARVAAALEQSIHQCWGSEPWLRHTVSSYSDALVCVQGIGVKQLTRSDSLTHNQRTCVSAHA